MSIYHYIDRYIWHIGSYIDPIALEQSVSKVVPCHIMVPYDG